MDERKLVRFGGLGAVLGVIVCFNPLAAGEVVEAGHRVSGSESLGR